MNYLRKPFVLENTVTHKKEIVSTFRQYLSLVGNQAVAARCFLNGMGSACGEWEARPQASFELV